MIYMNNAATSYPKPPCVAQAVAQALTDPPDEHLRGGFGSSDVFGEVRKELSKVLCAPDPDRIALGPNATWALNQAIFGCGLQPGDTVVSTRAEHNSVLRPLYRLRQQGIRVILLDTDLQGRVDPARWREALQTFRPRLAVLTHASNVTGAVNDAELFCRLAKEVNAIFLLDCSQTIGCISVNTELIKADMIAFTGHKYLLGPQGTGGLWVRSGLTLEPYLLGGTGIQSDRPDMPSRMPLHLEAGTGNEPSFRGLLSALRWQKDHPADFEEVLRKVRILEENLRNLGIHVISPFGIRTPVISFTVPGMSCPEVGYLLQESEEIVCRTGLHCAPEIFPCLGVSQTVRLSLSRFTTDGEVEAVIRAMEAIVS